MIAPAQSERDERGPCPGGREDAGVRSCVVGWKMRRYGKLCSLSLTFDPLARAYDRPVTPTAPPPHPTRASLACECVYNNSAPECARAERENMFYRRSVRMLGHFDAVPKWLSSSLSGFAAFLPSGAGWLVRSRAKNLTAYDLPSSLNMAMTLPDGRPSRSSFSASAASVPPTASARSRPPHHHTPTRPQQGEGGGSEDQPGGEYSTTPYITTSSGRPQRRYSRLTIRACY